jgi:sodium transport system permease protein
MSTIVTVFLKECLENLRDRRTLINSMLMGPLIGPVLIMAMMSVMLTRELDRAEQPLKLPVAGQEHAPNLVAFLRQHAVQVLPAPDDPEAAVKAQEHEVVLRIGKDYGEQWRKGEPAPVELIYDQSQRDARSPRDRAKDLLTEYNRQVGLLRLLARGVHPVLASPVVVVERDQSTALSRAGIVLAFLPYTMMFGAFIGGMYLAIDTTAGERERRSLEPLLATPNPPSHIMLGKLAATSAFAMVSLVLTLIAFALLFPRLPLDKLGFEIDFSLPIAARILAVCVPVVLLASALQTLIAAFAKSYREAQSYLQFLLFLPMLPSLAVMVVPLKAVTWMMATPLLSQNLVINKLVRGETVLPMHFALCIATTLVLALIATALAARVYHREQLAVST